MVGLEGRAVGSEREMAPDRLNTHLMIGRSLSENVFIECQRSFHRKGQQTVRSLALSMQMMIESSCFIKVQQLSECGAESPSLGG